MRDKLIVAPSPHIHSPRTTRTIMLEGGRIVLDLSGAQREKLDVPGLLALYRETVGAELANDRMLLTRDAPEKTEK